MQTTVKERLEALQSSLEIRSRLIPTLPTSTPCNGNLLRQFETRGDPVLEAMKGAAISFISDVRSRQRPYWLTLWGRAGKGNGTGKTFISGLIADALRASFGHVIPAKKCHWPSLCDRMQREEETTHAFSFAEDCGLLILDDIGAEHQTSAMISKLCRLMESRLRKWTIITTNLSPADWRDRDSRISSRLIRDGNRHLQCETTDFANRATTK